MSCYVVLSAVVGSGDENSWGSFSDVLTAVTALVSVFIAMTAVFFTRAQINKQDHHNQLMVTPNLSSTSMCDDEHFEYEYSLTNVGVGPAVVKEVVVSIDGEIYIGKHALGRCVRRLLEDVNYEGYLTHSVDSGVYISVGDSISVIKIKLEKGSKTRDFHYAFERRLKVSISYESIYGKGYSFSSEEDATPRE